MAYKLAERQGVLGPLDAGCAVNRRDVDDAGGLQNEEILFPRACAAVAKVLPEGTSLDDQAFNLSPKQKDIKNVQIQAFELIPAALDVGSRQMVGLDCSITQLDKLVQVFWGEHAR